jgi:pectate lyase
LARYAKIHAFNNYYEATGRSCDLYTDVQFYSENEIFRLVPSAANPTIKLSGNEPDDPRGAANVKVVNPWLINGATVQQINPSTIFVPSSYYSYTPDTANAALQTAIINGAGRQNVTTPISLQAPTNLVVK